jgi:hypothetical protein
MARALGRISLVVILTAAISYQSWSIIVPPTGTHFLFSAVPAAKFLSSLFDIDDEHRGAHTSPSIFLAPLFVMGASLLLVKARGHFCSELRFHYSTLQRMNVVLLI